MSEGTFSDVAGQMVPINHKLLIYLSFFFRKESLAFLGKLLCRLVLAGSTCLLCACWYLVLGLLACGVLVGTWYSVQCSCRSLFSVRGGLSRFDVVICLSGGVSYYYCIFPKLYYIFYLFVYLYCLVHFYLIFCYFYPLMLLYHSSSFYV